PYGVLQSAANQNRSIAGGNRTIVHLVAEHCEAGEGFLYPLSQKSKIFDSSPIGRAKGAAAPQQQPAKQQFLFPILPKNEEKRTGRCVFRFYSSISFFSAFSASTTMSG
ncbi:MAG: hypothetical protein IKW50_02515, partial [Oscillospiraceae bacterium]|nr:hypothetical protein [Oscillospiraceae bacterium]